MDDFLIRTELLLGKEEVKKLNDSKVLILGLGGVGSYSAEALARSGVGRLTLVDFDTIDITNINRQIPALHSTIGLNKTDVMKQRILDINPNCEVVTFHEFLDDSNRDILLKDQDFIVDAIDSLNPKVNLLEEVYHLQIPIISSMGAAGRIDPSKIKLSDLSKTEHCPFARRVRKYLGRRGIKKGIPVIYSTEKPVPPIEKTSSDEIEFRGRKRGILPSISYLPAMFGLWVASYVIRKLTDKI